METNTEPRRPSLLKQLLGAVGGAALALLLYQGYKVGSPVVTAWLVTPQSQIDADHPGSVRLNSEVSEYEYNRLAARAREIYQRFSADPAPKAELSRTGIEVTQPSVAHSSSVARVDLENLVAQQSAVSSSSSSLVYAEESSSSSSSFAFSASSISVEMVTADVASSARARAEARLQAKLAGENLPSSGIGTSLVAAVALGSAAFLRRKRGTR